MEPSFTHVPAEQLPLVERDGARVRVIAGRLEDAVSPVATFQSLTYLDVELSPNAEVSLPVHAAHALALYVAEGTVSVGGTEVARGVLAHLDDDAPLLSLHSKGGARLLVLGGTPLPDPLVIWWNFVVESVAEGRARYADWEAGRFPSLAP